MVMPDPSSSVDSMTTKMPTPRSNDQKKPTLSLDTKSELIVAQAFRHHGELCASHPWEVIVATLTLTVCMLTVESEPSNSLRRPPPLRRSCAAESCIDIEDYNAIDMIVMTLIRCIAVLYSYYQFCNLHKLGSKYILGIAGLFTVFSSFVFSSTVIKFLGNDISDLKDALFFFLLVIDLPKATVLAQFALSSKSHDEVRSNIAKGMALLGPTITLDTLVEALVIGVGILSGVERLEVLCCFACMSVIVNYVVFITFYPACLSLILELSRAGANGQPSWHDKSFLMRALQEDQKPNPVVQRVKIIMSAGLMLVHAHSHWTLASVDGEAHSPNLVVADQLISTNGTDDSPLPGYIIKWLTLSADHIVILILLLALTVKFIVFEGKDEITEQILMSEREEHFAVTATHEPGQTPVLDSVLRQKFTPEFWHINKTPAATLTPHIQVHKEKDEMDQAEGSDDDYLVMSTTRLPTIITFEDKQVQTDRILKSSSNNQEPIKQEEESEPRDVQECLNIYRDDGDTQQLTDTEVENLVRDGHISAHLLEKACADLERGVRVRRKLIASRAGFGNVFDNLPYTNYDYSLVMGACCENVVGYMPIPVGIAGPIHLDGRDVWVPMATTEGCLVASTTRGSRALCKCGVTSRIVNDGMTRGPVVRFPSLARASEAMLWIENPNKFIKIKESFNSTSRFAQLKKVHIRIAGRLLFIRFVATTGDAMGMNMVSKGSEAALKMIQNEFHDMEIISLSGNFCTDKKPAAINWVEGRGKSVVSEAVVPQAIVRNILKTSVKALVETNIHKNLIGSAMAGTLGGFNAHAANIVTAIFIATGQDPAQNVSSSNCITLMEPWGDDGEDLYVSCTMPSVEVGTIGGGTVLSSQGACLDILGVRGANVECPGENACQLARIICAAVLAAELSLMSALAAGDLVKSHLKLNRSSTNVQTTVVTRKISSSNTLAVKDCRGPIP